MLLPASPRTSTSLGLLLISLSTLMLENLLTRIFSVTMWYHFAFIAISVALFGMTVGALIVYLWPTRFRPSGVYHQLAASALLFSLTTAGALLLHTSLPLRLDGTPSGLISLALNYTTISVPFVFSGICVTLALTRFPEQISRLYAVDLIGAAAGCLLVLAALSWTDGPTAVFLCAAVASLGALAFAWQTQAGPLRPVAIALSASLMVFVAGNTYRVDHQTSVLRLRWAKGTTETPPLVEIWNPISRLAVRGDPNSQEEPFGFGISPTYPAGRSSRQLHLTIDAGAETVLTGFDGDLSQVDYLRYDVTNLAYLLKPNGSTLIIGSGGGRDVLSALAFDQARIVGVELNRGILDLTTGTFGDFTGHLEQDRRVSLIQDEARSYVSRSPDRFDIIQISLIDTWAAMSSGAYVLTENSLYTVEAFQSFMDHLADDGVLTISRWYEERSPVELHRLISLAANSLMARGVEDPRAHLLVYANVRPGNQVGIATLLLSPSSFSTQDLDRIARQADLMKFDPLLTPDAASDPTLAALASPEQHAAAIAAYPFDISPPTDERPFFFFTVGLGDLLSRQFWSAGLASLNMIAVYILGSLLVVVTALAVLCILIPLLVTTRRKGLTGAGPYLVYFACIGLAYILIELAQMQRLIIFLGHPTYSLSVVLFTLLLSSGLGSTTTRRVEVTTPSAMARWMLLLVVVGAAGWLTPRLLQQLGEAPTWARVGVSVGILFPMGMAMGMAFPMGMKAAAGRAQAFTPWLWGVNGAMSVLGSVLAIALALEAGISTAYWAGFGSYVLALAAFIGMRNRARRSH